MNLSFWFIRFCVLWFLFLAGCAKQKPPQPAPAHPVRVGVAVQKEAPIFIEALGHVDSITAISIKSRIEGELTGVYFTQGQEVKKGDLLFTIDPRPYQAALKEAQATLEQNLANLALASEKVKRYRTLANDEYYSQIDYETLQANYASTAALVEQNRAQVDSALINLNYCWIYAPIDGMMGILQVDFGNLVADDGTTLTTLNQMAPIYVTFSVPEFQLPSIQKYNKEMLKVLVPDHKNFQGNLRPDFPAQQSAELDGNLHQVVESEREAGQEKMGQIPKNFCGRVLAAYEDFTQGIFEGKLFMLNNQVDTDTGMISLRALFENADRELWPGQFVRTRLILHTIPDAVIIPYTAVQWTQSGPVIFVVKSDKSVEQRPVTLGQREDADIVILKGLQAGETIVLEGQLNLYNSAKVEII